MYDVPLRCMTKAYKGSIWTLRFADDGNALLLDPQGGLVQIIEPQLAQGAFTFPSFTSSIKNLHIATANGTFEFAPDAEALRTIKAYMDQSLLNSGNSAAEIAKLRKAGMKELLGGLGLSVGGIVVTAGTYLAAASSRGGGRYFIAHGVVLWGIIMACRGGAKMARAGRLVPQATPGFAVLPTMTHNASTPTAVVNTQVKTPPSPQVLSPLPPLAAPPPPLQQNI